MRSTSVHPAPQAELASAIKHTDKPKQSNHVTLSKVHVREYERILGDHPAAATGPPIGIGWKYSNGRACRLDYYEEMREEKKKRREKQRLRNQIMLKKKSKEDGGQLHLVDMGKKSMVYEPLPGGARRDMLKYDLKYTDEEIDAAVSECLEIRKQRFRTACFLKVSAFLSGKKLEDHVASPSNKLRGAVRAVILAISRGDLIDNTLWE